MMTSLQLANCSIFVPRRRGTLSLRLWINSYPPTLYPIDKHRPVISHLVTILLLIFSCSLYQKRQEPGQVTLKIGARMRRRPSAVKPIWHRWQLGNICCTSHVRNVALIKLNAIFRKQFGQRFDQVRFARRSDSGRPTSQSCNRAL